MDMNTEEYWENRFKTDWKSNFGPEQTLLHYTIFIDYLPDWIKRTISENRYSICDMGCGMGEGVNEVHKVFPQSEVYGMDFSDSAIESASDNYQDENITFFKGDILNIDYDFDVITTLHTLEHFSNPFEICENLSNHCKYLIITVPFRERDLWKEHEFSFEYSSFPLYLNNMRLVFYREIEPIFFKAGDYTLKEQILVIYADESIVRDFSLDDMNSYYDDFLRLRQDLERIKSENKDLKKENKKIRKKNKSLKKENKHFKSTKAYKIWKRYADFKD
jgi:hypothetical protein